MCPMQGEDGAMSRPRHMGSHAFIILGICGVALATWFTLDDGSVQPSARQAASPAPSEGWAEPKASEQFEPRKLVDGAAGDSAKSVLQLPSKLPDDYSSLVAMHLLPAPLSLQLSALPGVEAMQRAMATKVSTIVPSTTVAALAQQDAAYMARLGELVAQQLREGRGLLVVGELKPEPGAGARHFWTRPGLTEVAGLPVGVYVDVGEGDDELTAYDQAATSLRRTLAYERAGVFNRRSDADRRAAVERFEQRFAETKGRDWTLFGVEHSDGPFLRIDRDSSTLLLQ